MINNSLNQFRLKPLRTAMLTGMVVLSPALASSGCAGTAQNPCAAKAAKACNPVGSRAGAVTH